MEIGVNGRNILKYVKIDGNGNRWKFLEIEGNRWK